MPSSLLCKYSVAAAIAISQQDYRNYVTAISVAPSRTQSFSEISPKRGVPTRVSPAANFIQTELSPRKLLQETTAAEPTPAPYTIDTGDTAFMLFACTVVMLQTPAMGILQAGLIRRKNSLSMLMQTLMGMCIGSMLWFLVGYSFVFHSSLGGIFGTFDCMFLTCVGSQPNSLAPAIPGVLFAAWQMMFALMVPIIVTGSWCEKMHFAAYLEFIIIWPLLVYYPLAHWIWNQNGWLMTLGGDKGGGVVDFAGGLTIHTASGIAGFVVSFMLQRRKPNATAVMHHNLPLTIVGGSLVWAGWYSFNGGSALMANLQAGNALLSTHLSACVSGIVWVLLGYRNDGKWHLTDVLNGALAGLACITPGSGYVKPWSATLFGLIGGILSFNAIPFFKDRMKLDDVLDVAALQGVPGITGTILTGIFASKDVQVTDTPVVGLLESGSARQLGFQCVGAVVTVLWALFASFVTLLIMKKTVGIDITADWEEQGLDKVQIGEQAYDDELKMLDDIGHDGLISRMCAAAGRGNVKLLQKLVAGGGDIHGADYDRRTPAHLAASEGRLNVLEFLQRSNVDFNVLDRFGNSPLNDAFDNNRNKAVKWLRERKCTLTMEKYFNSFLEASGSGQLEVITRLLEAGFDPDVADYDQRTALMVAASEAQPAAVQLLLAYNASKELRDRWGATALDSANKVSQSNPCVRLLRDDDEAESKSREFHRILSAGGSVINESTPLVAADQLRQLQSQNMREQLAKEAASIREFCTAASGGDVKAIKRLVKKGGDPTLADYDRRTPLHLAASEGKLEVVKYLSKVKNININCMDRWHSTPLADAIRHHHMEIAVYLRSMGAISIRKNVGSELCQLAAKGDLEKLRNQFEHSIDLSVGDYDSRTPLHLASSEGHVDVVHFLLNTAGVAAAPQDRYGFTPFEDAKRYNHQEIMQLLRQAGGAGD